MTKKLRISNELSIPLDAVTQTFGILAVKGSGKSYTASVMAEEMLKNNQQIIVIDVTGAWYGLKSSANGKAEGFPIAIFGGDHADIPLDEHSGEIIAQAIVDKGFSAILDLSLLRKGQMTRFLASFLETLYRINRKPVHLFADEADDYVPQKVFGDQARTVGAMEDIVKRGRKKGIGTSLITQRPASVNKDVLTQCEILIALRMSHPRDIDAIKEWISVHSSINQAKEMIENLPSMSTGTAYVWSPSWLKVFERVKIRTRETFDSGATPKPGEKISMPTKLAKIDIEKLGKEINDTIDKAKAEDPKELKRRVADLEKQLKNSNGSEQYKILMERTKRLEQNMHDSVQASKKFINGISKNVEFLQRMILDYQQHVGPVALIPHGTISFIQSPVKDIVDKANFVKSGGDQSLMFDPRKTLLQKKGESSGLPPGEKIILTALIQFENGVLRNQLSILTGYKRSSRDAYIARLIGKELAIQDGNRILATDEGIKAMPNIEALPIGVDLRNYWLEKLPEGERAILEVLIAHYPKSIVRSDFDKYIDYKRSSRDAYLSRLIAKELVTQSGSNVKASENLF